MRTLLLASLLAVAVPATAAQADTLPSLYAGLVGGYTASSGLDEGDPDPMGVALGLRGGLTIPTTDIYVGALFLYHVGASVDVPGGEISNSSYMLGAEAGYELGLGPLVLRPSLGIGTLQSSVSVDGTDASIEVDGEGALYVSPGAALMLKLGLLVGAEVRYNLVANDNVPDSLSILGTVGFGI